MNTNAAQKDNFSPAIIDFHLHLDGSVPLHTARHLAQMQGIGIPSSDEQLKRLMSLTPDCKNLNDYLARFAFASSLLHTKEALAICAADLLEELKNEGLLYAEIRFAPQKSCEMGLSQAEATEAVLEGMRRVDFPCSLILSMMRGNDTHAANLETVEVAKAFHGKGVVAVDLAGAEALFPTSSFKEEFAKVRESGVPLIVHAGEAAGAHSVGEAVRAGARRIGHGVRSLEDKTVVDMLVAGEVTLELCPTSNLDTGMFPSYSDYPLRRLMDAGIRVSINTDNMTISGTTLADEWRHMIDAFELTDEEIRHILHDSVVASFAPEDVKQRLFNAIS